MFSDSNYAHTLLFRDAARGVITGGLGGAKDTKLEDLEPESGDGIGGFGHEALAMKGGIEPEAAIVAFIFLVEVDATNDAARSGFRADTPTPTITTGDRRESDVPKEGERAIGRIGPWHALGHIADDFPLRKDELDLRSVGEFERAKEEASGFERRNHGIPGMGAPSAPHQNMIRESVFGIVPSLEPKTGTLRKWSGGTQKCKGKTPEII